jgi:hypothetical protein
MDIITRTTDVFPLHQISSVEIDGKHFCHFLEDIQRPTGQKVNGWTGIPRTGVVRPYKLGIQPSPRFGRDMIVIYTEDDGVTIKLNKMEFKYCYVHGGNTHLSTLGCPIAGYNLIKRVTPMKYGKHSFEIEETIVQETAETDFFNLVAPEILARKEPKLFML